MQLKNKPELLSPAGGEKSVRAAVNGGADAVYFGGFKGSARANAENIPDDKLEEIIDFCHLRGVKAYIAVNTVCKDGEIPAILSFVEKAYKFGADALIVTDIGLFMLIRQFFPKMPLHASTQMTAHSAFDVKFLEDMGFSRTVLARELSAEEITEINNECDSETEIFAHGALCVCYSGRCLMSSFIDPKAGRSGNRGTCAQPCRKFYVLMNGTAPIKTGFLLSPKDLMGVKMLDSLAETGVAALKIEGRMKTPEYVYQVTDMYRERLESGSVSEEAVNEAAQIFNRGGFTDGYFFNHSMFPIMSVKTPKNTGVLVGKVENYDYVLNKCKISVDADLNPGDGIEIWTKALPHPGGGVNKAAAAGGIAVVTVTGGDKNDYDIQKGDPVYKTLDKQLNDRLSNLAARDTRKIKVGGYFRAVVGQPFYVRLDFEGLSAEAFGGEVGEAQNRPVSEETILQQLMKTGNTTLEIDYKNFDLGENIFIGLKEINEVRRCAVEKLSEMIAARYKRPAKVAELVAVKREDLGSVKKSMTVQVQNAEQLDSAITAGNGKIGSIYAESGIFSGMSIEGINNLCKRCENNGIELFAALPPIQKSGKDGVIPELEKTELAGFLVRTFGQIYELEQLGSQKKIATDYHFNVLNRYALEFFEDMDVRSVALSVELSLDGVDGFGSEACELIIYGKQVVMTTQQCPVGLYAANKTNGKFCRLKNDSDSYYFKDKTGATFPIITNCDICTAYVLNGKPIFMANKMRDVSASPVGYLRLVFTDEPPEMVGEIIGVYDGARKGILPEIKEGFEFTYGHFYRH